MIRDIFSLYTLQNISSPISSSLIWTLTKYFLQIVKLRMKQLLQNALCVIQGSFLECVPINVVPCRFQTKIIWAIIFVHAILPKQVSKGVMNLI